MNSDRTLSDLLNLKFDIEKSFFKKTHFLNDTFENLFQKDMEKNSFKSNLVSSIIIISSYITSLIFIIFSYFKIIQLSICLIFFSISSIILTFSFKNTNKKHQLICDNIQIFLSFLNLSIILINICMYFNKENNDHHMELLRIIIYQCLSTNFYMITKLEANIYISLFYILLNTSTIIISILFSNKNNYFYVEIIINFSTFLIFYLLRKEWDIKLRNFFAEKYKFEAFYLYNSDYLSALNGFTINIKNNLKLFYNKKINNLIDNILPDKKNKEVESQLTPIVYKYEAIKNLEQD